MRPLDAVILPQRQQVKNPHAKNTVTRDNVSMSNQKENRAGFHDRLRAALDRTGEKDRKISLAVTGSADFIRSTFRAGSIPGAVNLRALADYLGTTDDYLLTGTSHNSEPEARHAGNLASPSRVFRGFAPDPPMSASPLFRDLPIVGSVLGCNDHDFDGGPPVETHILGMGEIIAHVRRPEKLAGNRTSYALYISGDSQSPKFEPGDLIIVNPARQPAIGDDVVVQLRDDADQIVTAVIKRLLRRTSTEITLRQFNPPRDIILPITRVAAVHRIMTLSDLVDG